MHVGFLSAAGDSQSFTDSISDERESSYESKENLAREVFAELRKAVSFANHGYALPDVGDLLQPPSSTNRPSDPMAFIDLFNVSAAMLFLKDQGIATEEKLAPYLKASDVRWRAARVRIGALLASAMRTPEPGAEKKITTAQEKNLESTAEVDTEGAAGQTPEQKSEGPKNETESANLGKGAVERTQKNQDPQTIS